MRRARRKCRGILRQIPRAPTSTGKELQIGKGAGGAEEDSACPSLLVAEAEGIRDKGGGVARHSHGPLLRWQWQGLARPPEGRPMASRGHIICIGISSMLMQFPGFPGHRCDVFHKLCSYTLSDAGLALKMQNSEVVVLLERMRS